MCGIVGVVQYESPLSRELRHRALRILFSETMLQTEPRGRDATGLYQIHEDGDWMMTKKGQKVTEWILEQRKGNDTDPIVYPEIVDTWLEHQSELKSLVGHCRAATVGSRGRDNKDNHPFAIQLDEENAILGIHNGTLTNHETVFKKLPQELPRLGSVDSECIFHFLYYLTEKGTKPVDPDMLKYMGERLEGAYAVIMANSRFPNQVVTFRKDRPMEYFMIAPLNIVLMASEKKFVDAAIEKYDFIRFFIPEYADLPRLNYVNKILLDRDFRIFDLSKPWPEGTLYQESLNKISTTGAMVNFNKIIKEDWKENSSSTTGVIYSKNQSNTKTNNQTPSTNGSQTKDTKSGSNVSQKEDTGILVEIEIGEEKEAGKAWTSTKALGVIPEFTKPYDVAKLIGLSAVDITSNNILKVCSRLSKYFFTLGYALSRNEHAKKVEEIKKKAKNQAEKLETITEKQKKAQNHVWEYRQICLLLKALHEGGYKTSLDNVEKALASYSSLSKERKQDLIIAAKTVLDSEDAIKTVKALIASFEGADSRKSEQKISSY